MIAVCAVSTAFAGYHNQKVNNNMALALANEGKINARQGLTHHLQAKPEHITLEQATTAPPTIASWLAGIQCTDKYDILRGFAYGLQYSAATQGLCYTSIDAAINSMESIQQLLAQFYNPTVWADIINLANNYVTYLSGISNNCNIYKLLNQFTTPPTTFVPQILARLGGGAINEIPSELTLIEKAKTCYIASEHAAKIFSLVLDYYI